MEIHLLALEDEGANAILPSISNRSQLPIEYQSKVLTWPLANACRAFTVIVAEIGE